MPVHALLPRVVFSLLIFTVASILVLGYAYTQIRGPVGAQEPGYPVTIPWTDALRQIETLLFSSIAIFLLGVIMIYWAGSGGKSKMQEAPMSDV